MRWYAFAVAQSPVESDGATAEVASRRRRRLVIAICLVVYVVLAVAVFWPAVPWNNSRLPSTPLGTIGMSSYGYGDPAQMTWFLAWVPFALSHGLSLFQTNYLDYPLGVNLASNTSAPLLGLLASPITLTLGPIAAFNVLLRLAFASSAASMFLVLRNWCRWPVAFVGGLAYGFGPYMVTQGQSHLNLVFAPIPPLIVWCLYELLFEQRRRPLRMGVLLGLLAGAQVLIAPEPLALLALVVLIGLLGMAVVARNDLRSQFGNLARAAGPAIVAFFVVDGWYAWSLLFAPGHLVGPVLPTEALQLYRADLLGPIVPTLNEALGPYRLWGISERFVAGNVTENVTYMGVAALGLLVFVAIRWRRNRIVLFSSFLSFVALFLSLGSPLDIDAHATRIRLPEALLAHIPVLDNVVPARFGFVVWLFAVIALAIGADHLLRFIADRASLTLPATLGRAGAVLALLLAVAMIVPRLPFQTHSAGFPPDTESVLNAIPSGSITLTYPYATSVDTEVMSWQAQDEMRFRIIGGYATVQAAYNSFAIAAGYGRYGLEFQPLLPKPAIQEFLLSAQYGHFDIFYPQVSTDVLPRRALCTFLATYHVHAVVYWKHGYDPTVVRELFGSDLGKPVRTSHNGALSVWLTPPGSCRP